jgi:hypothetical protein
MEFTLNINKDTRKVIISVYENGKLLTEYETLPFSEESLKAMVHWTDNDIKTFLRFSNGGYHEKHR